MLGWLQKQQQSQLTEVVPVSYSAADTVMEAPSRELGWRMAALSQRLANLAQHALNAESAYDANLSEVEARVLAMTQEIEQAVIRMESGMAEAEALRQEAQQNLTEAGSAVSNGLQELDQSLTEKLARVSSVLNGLERIGKDLDMLALNAAIQAASAGDAGRSFSVVADEVRKLAHHTVKNSKDAAQLLDFSDFQDQLRQLRISSAESAETANQDTTHAFSRAEEAVSSMGRSLESLAEHSRVINAMQDLNRNTFERQRRKIEWTQTLANELVAVKHVDDTALADPLDKVIYQEAIRTVPGFDRLDDIRKRKTLRVAIEPAFKGLSFRMKPGEPLRGLDVDYATAFAQYLGVSVQFVEYPWDQCTELLQSGPRRGQPEADVVWSALPPNAAYRGVAFSEAYTYLHYVLARRVGDQQVTGLQSLDGKVLGCINDPAAFATLEAAGLRWSKHENNDKGIARLANIIGYTDQSIIHDALADGTVDAFAVDQPIFAWACYGKDSPWYGRIEMVPGNLAAAPWYYAAAVADDASSYTLLAEINRFIAAFSKKPERQEIEKRWQFNPVQGTGSYRDEAGGLRGEPELRQSWQQSN